MAVSKTIICACRRPARPHAKPSHGHLAKPPKLMTPTLKPKKIKFKDLPPEVQDKERKRLSEAGKAASRADKVKAGKAGWQARLRKLLDEAGYEIEEGDIPEVRPPETEPKAAPPPPPKRPTPT